MSNALYDSDTLKLEAKGYIERHRSKDDERNLLVSITEKGEALKDEAIEVPYKMIQCVNLSKEEAQELYRLLHKLLDTVD